MKCKRCQTIEEVKEVRSELKINKAKALFDVALIELIQSECTCSKIPA